MDTVCSSTAHLFFFRMNVERSIQQHSYSYSMHFISVYTVHSTRSQTQYLFLWKVLFIQFRVHERSFHYFTGNISNDRQLIRLFTFNFWLKFNLCEYIMKTFNVHWTISTINYQLPPMGLIVLSFIFKLWIYNWIFEFEAQHRINWWTFFRINKKKRIANKL